MNQPVSNATVVLIERESKNGSIFGANSSCTEIASAITDSDGNCSFDNEKLKKKDKFNYFLGIKEAYGRSSFYPCGGKSSGFLKLGHSQDVSLDASSFEGSFRVQYNRALNPSQSGDSLLVSISSPKYHVPGEPYPFGGGGVFFACPTHDHNSYPYPELILTPEVKSSAGRHVLHIRKRKMGVIIISADTVMIEPYKTKVIEINW